MERTKKLPVKSIHPIAILLFILGITAVVYLPSLQNQFTNWDDQKHLLETPLVRSLAPSNIVQIFKSIVNDTYIPLTMLTYAFEYHFFGLNPFIYHLVSLLFHLVLVGLIYILGLRMGLNSGAAGLGALLFGIHPQHVEAVAWVTGRKDILYSIFYIGTILLYGRYCLTKQKSYYFLSLTLCILSILAKPSALSLPFILLLYDWFEKGNWSRSLCFNKLPYLIVIVPILWLTFQANAQLATMSQNLINGFLIFIWSATFYLNKFFLPLILTPIYQLPQPISIFHFSYLFPLIEFFVIIILIFKHRQNRLFIFSFFFYFVSIFPLLHWDTIPRTETLADRYMYLPSIGICLLLGNFLYKLFDQCKSDIIWKCLVGVGIALLLTFLFLKTWIQTKIWKDGKTLWEHVLRYYPDQPIVYNNLADYYLKKDIVNEKILELCRKALSLNSNYAEAHINLGNALARLDRIDEGIPHFKEAIRINPTEGVAYANLGTAYYEQEKYSEAVVQLKTAIQFGMNIPEIHQLLERAQQKAGQIKMQR